MTRARTSAVAAAAILVIAALAGCAGRSPVSQPPGGTPPAPPVPLSTSWSAAGGSWAVVRTGGKSVGGVFWQLVVRPAGSTRWRLATPPGVADNGGLVVTGTGSHLSAGFLPNQLLRFTPLASTTDDGAHWSQGLLNASLTAAPSALSVLPDGRLLAITAKGAQESAPGGTSWKSLVTLRALAATPAGRACGLTRLTAVAASPAGNPLLAGDCSRPGRIAIFEQTSGGWHVLQQTLPRALTTMPIGVVQMASITVGTHVLLAAGVGSRREIVHAWLPGESQTLDAGAPLPSRAGQLTSTFFAADGAWGAVISGREVIFDAPAGPAGFCSSHCAGSVNGVSARLPGPDATAVLVSVPRPGKGAASAELSALVPGLDTVAIWEQDKAGKWHRTQVITIPSAPS